MPIFTLSKMTVCSPQPLCANLYAMAAPCAPPPQMTTLALGGKSEVGKISSLAYLRLWSCLDHDVDVDSHRRCDLCCLGRGRFPST